MSQFKSENQSGYTKKSWINDLMNDKVLSANLTEEYAHDVLESVADETFSNLDAAIADLSLRTGLTASEVGIIKTAAIKMVQACDDIPGNVKEEDKPAGAEAELLKTTDEEEDKPAGAEAILQRKKKEVAASKKVIADSNLDSKSVEELEALIYNWMTVAMPGATGKDTQMLISQRVKEAEAILQRKKKEAEGSSCGCDVKTSGYQRKLEDNKRGKGQEKEKKEEGKQGGKKKELPEALKKHMFKKKIKMDKKKSCSSLTSKIREAWFQNQTEAPSAEAGGKTVESNPERMGFPSELKYDRLEVSAPGGEDSRPFEIKKYKDEASETKKVMGPKGEEFKLKVEMQRIPEGEKEANARLTALRQIVADKKILNKKAEESIESYVQRRYETTPDEIDMGWEVIIRNRPELITEEVINKYAYSFSDRTWNALAGLDMNRRYKGERELVTPQIKDKYKNKWSPTLKFNFGIPLSPKEYEWLNRQEERDAAGLDYEEEFNDEEFQSDEQHGRRMRGRI